jgi:hypothetical protein
MSDLKVALEELKEEFDSGMLTAISTPVKQKRTGLLWASVVALGCALIGMAALRLLPHRSGDSALSRPVPLTSYQGDERQADFSPDGNQVAFT